MQPEDLKHEDGYKAFIQQVVASGEVWGLEGEEGLAISSSGDDEERDVIPFWSDEALARGVATEDWAAFKPESMPLPEFLESWLVNMHNDEMMVGTNWGADLNGKETEPLVLALDISNELIASGKSIELIHFSGITDYQQKIREASGL